MDVEMNEHEMENLTRALAAQHWKMAKLQRIYEGQTGRRYLPSIPARAPGIHEDSIISEWERKNGVKFSKGTVYRKKEFALVTSAG
jgi:hypothetical protein